MQRLYDDGNATTTSATPTNDGNAQTVAETSVYVINRNINSKWVGIMGGRLEIQIYEMISFTVYSNINKLKHNRILGSYCVFSEYGGGL